MTETQYVVLKIYQFSDLQITYIAEYIVVTCCINIRIKLSRNQTGLLFHFEI